MVGIPEIIRCPQGGHTQGDHAKADIAEVVGVLELCRGGGCPGITLELLMEYGRKYAAGRACLMNLAWLGSKC